MTVKALIGYDVMPGMSHDDYDAWLWDVHVPDLLANPHLERLVFNTVQSSVATTSGGATAVDQRFALYRIAEMHFLDFDQYGRYRKWFEDHPIPPDRGPAGRSDFRFYVLCTVTEVDRPDDAAALAGGIATST